MIRRVQNEYKLSSQTLTELILTESIYQFATSYVPPYHQLRTISSPVNNGFGHDFWIDLYLEIMSDWKRDSISQSWLKVIVLFNLLHMRSQGTFQYISTIGNVMVLIQVDLLVIVVTIHRLSKNRLVSNLWYHVIITTISKDIPKYIGFI